MNCREVEDRIQDLLDDRSSLNEDPALHAHMQDCEACSRMIGEYTLLFGPQADVLNFTGSSVSTSLTKSNCGPGMRIAKVMFALAAAVVLFVQPVIWGWRHWEQSPQLAATSDSLVNEVGELESARKATSTPSEIPVAALVQREGRSEIDVASILDFSDAFSEIDLSNFHVAEIPVVRPLAKPVNVTWNRLMESLPNFDQPAEMQSDQLQEMQMDSNQLQKLLHSWSRIFS